VAGETEVLGGNLPQCCFVHHKSDMICARFEPGTPLCEAGEQPPRLRHGFRLSFGICSVDYHDDTVLLAVGEP
jgi:hypothetical protein